MLQAWAFLLSSEVQRAVIGCGEIHVTDFGMFDGAAWLG
jgi:hypothetical protein